MSDFPKKASPGSRRRARSSKPRRPQQQPSPRRQRSPRRRPGMFEDMIDPVRHLQRSERRSSRSPWPSRSQTPPIRLPKLPLPVTYGIRLLIVGLGVAAIAGTVLSVIAPTGNSIAEGVASDAPGAIAAPAATSPQQLNQVQELSDLKNQLAELQDIIPELTSTLYLVDLDTGSYVDVSGEVAVPAASTIKVPILVAFFQAVDSGRLAIDQTMAIQADQVVGGSGSMQEQPVGTRYTALEVATQMIIDSDNTATNMMIELLGGSEALNRQFADWGLVATVLRAPLPDIEGTNTTSAQDLVRVMAYLHQGDVLSLRSRDRALNILQRTYNKKLLPAGVSETTITYNKTGYISQLLGDVALMDLPNGKRYALAVLVQRADNDGRAQELIRRISQTVYQQMDSDIVPVRPAESADLTAPAAPPSEPAEPAPVE